MSSATFCARHMCVIFSDINKVRTPVLSICSVTSRSVRFVFSNTVSMPNAERANMCIAMDAEFSAHKAIRLSPRR